MRWTLCAALLLLSGCFIEPLDEARLEIQVTLQAQAAEGACARVDDILELEGCGAWLQIEAKGEGAPVYVEEGVAGGEAHPETLSFTLDLDPGPRTITLLGYLPGDPTRAYGAEAEIALEAGQVEALELILEPLPTGEVSVPEGVTRVEVFDLEAKVRFEAAGEALSLPARRYEISAYDAEGATLKRAEVTPEVGGVIAL